MNLKSIIPQSIIGQFEIEDLDSICRIIGEEKSLYRVLCQEGSNILINKRENNLYSVGDWVLVQENIITRLSLPINSLARQNNKKVQIIANNVDQMWIVTSANDELNFNRIERYIHMAISSEVKPSIILTKIDLLEEPILSEKILELKKRFPETNIISLSVGLNLNCHLILEMLTPRETIALMGSSGVGKSTLVNFIRKNSDQQTKEIDKNSKGQHTTTSRKMFLLENGCFIIDNPGIRGVAAIGNDITQNNLCKFSNCTHINELGCYFLDKLLTGEISQESFDNFKKIERENHYLNSKNNLKNKLEQKAKWKAITKNARKK